MRVRSNEFRLTSSPRSDIRLDVPGCTIGISEAGPVSTAGLGLRTRSRSRRRGASFHCCLFAL